MFLSQYNRIVAKISRKEAALALAYDTYDSLVDSKVSSFELDTGEADQRVTNRKLSDVAKAITALEAEIELEYRKLRGTANVRSLLCRRGY